MDRSVERTRKVVWLNGQLVPQEEATVSAGDFGLQFGEGLFETMRAERGRIAYLDRHLARLRRGSEFLKLPLPSEAELRRGLTDLLNVPGDAPKRVRVTVTRGVGESVESPGDDPPTVLMAARPAGPAHGRLSAIWSPFRRNEYSPLCSLKTTSYLENVLAKRKAWAYGADEALFLNTKGQVAEGASSNVFIWQEGLLRTPPIDAGILPGVIRSVILERASASGIGVHEMPLTPNDLQFCDAPFLTNAIIGVALIIAIERQAVGTLYRDTIAARLQEMLWRPDDYQTP